MPTEKENLSEGDVLKGAGAAAARIRARIAAKTAVAKEEKTEETENIPVSLVSKEEEKKETEPENPPEKENREKRLLDDIEKGGINESEARRLFNILEIPEDEINKIIAGKKKEDLGEEKKETEPEKSPEGHKPEEENENPMEEKFKELEQRLGQREKDKDALLKQAEEFRMVVYNLQRLKDIFGTNFKSVDNAEKNHLIDLFKNADSALKNKNLEELNNFLFLIETGLAEMARKIDEEKQAKEAEKEIEKEAEKLPQEERQGFFKKLANAGWFLKEQKAKAMKLALKETAEGFLILTKKGKETRHFRKKQEIRSNYMSSFIQNLKMGRDEVAKKLEEEGKTKEEINEFLKERNKEIDELLKNEIESIKDEDYNDYRAEEKEAKEKEAGKIYRFLNAYSKNVYEKEEKLANKKRKQAKMGALQKASGLGQLFGNTARAGRIFYDFGRSLNPLKSITAASLFLGRFAEASKEARLMNTEVKSRTRIGEEMEETHRKNAEGEWDSEFLKAYEEALMIQEEAKKTGKVDANGNLKLSEEMYENAYKKFVNFDVLKRVGAYDEIVEDFVEDTQIEFETETDPSKKVNLQARIQFLNKIKSGKIAVKEQLDNVLLSEAFLDGIITEKEKAFLSQAYDSYNKCALNTRGFIQKSAAWSIKKQSLWLNAEIVNIDLDKKLTAEQKKLKQEFYFQMFESYLKDIDRMVDQAGMVDLLSYTARLTEKTAKAVSIAMIVDTVWKLWEGGLDIFSGKKRIFAPSVSGVVEEAPARIPEERGEERETGGWKERIKERVIGKETKKEEEAPATVPRGQEKEGGWFDWIPGLGVEEKPEVSSETRPQTAPKAPFAPGETPVPKTPKEELNEIEQFLKEEGEEEQSSLEPEKEERVSFKIPLIQTEEAYADFKSRYKQLTPETQKEIKEILKVLPETEKEKILKNGFEGKKGGDGLLNYALDRKAQNYFDNHYNFYLRGAKAGSPVSKEFVNMFNIQQNEDTALKILKGENTFNGKIGKEGLREYMYDYLRRVEAQKARPAPLAAEAPLAPKEESAEKTAEQKKRELEQKKRELRESPQKKAEKAAPSPPQEDPSSLEQKRAEKLIPRPGARPEIPVSKKHLAIIEKKGSLWNAMMAMNLENKTFNKAWADAEIYIDGEETDYKAHEVGLVDPKTKVIYNEKTNTIHIIPPHGGKVGDNSALYEKFQKKGVETPDWLKKELGIKEGKAPELLEEAPSEPSEEGEEKEKAPKPEEPLNKVEELSEKTGLRKEDINLIAENLKIEPEKLEQSFLEIVKSDEEAFKTKENVWIAERLEFFHNHSEIPLKDAQEIFKDTTVINKNLNTNFTPQEFYPRFSGHKIDIFDDSARERVIIKTSEHEFNIYINKAEIDQKIFKSLFSSDEYISVEINPDELSAEYLDDIFKRIAEKSKRETALSKFIEEKLEIDRNVEGKIVSEEDNKTFDWLYKMLRTVDLKTVLDEDWPKKFRSAIPVFKSKEEKSAGTLRDFFIEYLKENKDIALEDNDYKKPCGKVLTKYVEKLTTRR